VCALRRPRSNTPLQALVTLNDPVYVEASQALARRMAEAPGSVSDKARHGFRLCLARPPREKELRALIKLYEAARADYAKQTEAAEQFAGSKEPRTKGPQANGTAAQQSRITNDAPRSTLHAPPLPDLAAWTTVGNVL